MPQPLNHFVCPRTEDCYLILADDDGGWIYQGQPVDLISANYAPDAGLIEYRWAVTPADKGLSSWDKAQGAINALGLSPVKRS